MCATCRTCSTVSLPCPGAAAARPEGRPETVRPGKREERNDGRKTETQLLAARTAEEEGRGGRGGNRRRDPAGHGGGGSGAGKRVDRAAGHGGIAPAARPGVRGRGVRRRAAGRNLGRGGGKRPASSEGTATIAAAWEEEAGRRARPGVGGRGRRGAGPGGGTPLSRGCGVGGWTAGACRAAVPGPGGGAPNNGGRGVGRAGRAGGGGCAGRTGGGPSSDR